MNERAAQKMGNTKSKSETLGVKAQAEGTMNPLYSLLDLSGKRSDPDTWKVIYFDQAYVSGVGKRSFPNT